MSFPPGPRTPALVQALGLWRDPIRLFSRRRSRYGDVFTVRFPSFPRLVYVADPEREDLYPDPLEFRPERFLERQGQGYAWIPFGGGVRRCIGASFAQYEMRIVLRTILERADLRAPEARPERLRPRNITMAPARGGRVVVERQLESPSPQLPVGAASG
jgi:cytochrome P450